MTRSKKMNPSKAKVVVKRQRRHSIHWKKVIDTRTWKDARETFKAIYGVALLASRPKTSALMDIADWIHMYEPQNAGLHRLEQKHPYPKSDRPRGHADVDAVKYLTTTKNNISPILLYHDSVKHEYVLLDGVHRLVAAKLIHSPVRFSIVKV